MFARLRCGSSGPGCGIGGETWKKQKTLQPISSGAPSQALTYKFWPEMDQERSWERRVRVVAALCCCSSRVSATVEAGDDLQPEATPLARMALVFASVRPCDLCSTGSTVFQSRVLHLLGGSLSDLPSGFRFWARVFAG